MHGHEFVQKYAVEKSSPYGELRSTRALDHHANRSDKPRRECGVFYCPRLRPLNLKEMDHERPSNPAAGPLAAAGHAISRWRDRCTLAAPPGAALRSRPDRRTDPGCDLGRRPAAVVIGTGAFGRTGAHRARRIGTPAADLSRAGRRLDGEAVRGDRRDGGLADRLLSELEPLLPAPLAARAASALHRTRRSRLMAGRAL